MWILYCVVTIAFPASPQFYIDTPYLQQMHRKSVVDEAYVPKGPEKKEMTLAEKAVYFEELTRERHVRYGLVAECGLRRPGELSTFYPKDTDNDGLWTSMYVATEAFRFAVTGDEEARRFAQESLAALIRLEEINGIEGFVSRSFTKDKEKKFHRKWHPTDDGVWYWKGDTSSDEIVGHFFAYSVYYDLVADEKEKKKIAEVVSHIMDHIIENNLALVDIDGYPTSWGRWGREP